MRALAPAVAIALPALLALQAAARDPMTAGGVVAASAGERVVLLDPASGAVARFDTGPVGFLFPAPGGLLFAPDLVNGRTAVLDLRTATVAERLDGVTMPRFGGQADRYLVIAGDVLAFTYPERAPLLRVRAGIESPWQVLMTPDDMMVLVLERRPDGGGPSTLVAVDLIDRKVVQRAILPGDVTRMAMSQQLGLLALADRTESSVALLEPATLATVLRIPVEGSPVDVAFARDGNRLVTVSNSGGRAALSAVELKPGRREIKVKPRLETELGAPAVRLALDPTGAFAAVALSPGRVEVRELDKGAVVGAVELGDTPRDLAWCDPTREGPVMPEWSDRQPTPAVRDLRRPPGD